MNGAVRVTALVALVVLLADGAGAGGLRLLEDAWLREPTWSRAEDGAGGAGAFAWVAAGTGRLYGLPELPLSSLRVATGRRGAVATWGVEAAWQRLGRDLLQVDQLEVTAGRVGRWRCRGRALVERRLLAGVPAEDRRRIEALLGWGWSTPAGSAGYCDLHLALHDGMDRDPRHVVPRIRIVLELGPAGCALAWDRRGDGTPLLGVEFTVELSRTAAVAWRYDGGSRSLGWGLVLRRGSLLVRTSHLVHPELGASHRWQVAAGGGRLPAARGR